MDTLDTVQFKRLGVADVPCYTMSIKELTAALCKVQAAMRPAIKDAENPHLRSKYADLLSVWAAARQPLADNGLAVFQPVTSNAETGSVTVTTFLVHAASGEWMSAPLTMKAEKNTAQGLGSAITYARRYSLASMIGVVTDEDDDGHAASGDMAARRQTKEEKDALVQKRIAEETKPKATTTKAPKPMVVPPADDSAFKNMLASFAAIKPKLGDDHYYRILGAAGYTHANEFTDMDTARATYSEMKRELEAMIAADKKGGN